jgi:hypothetical protein
VPAAAVIPAPIAYVKIVAVKKLVAGSRGSPLPWDYFEKIRVFKAGLCSDILAWNNGRRRRSVGAS